MSALSSVSCALSIVALKNIHSRYIVLSSSACAAPLAANCSSALPRPYQPGKTKRLCIHEKTHGIARRSSTDFVARRNVGREPSFSPPISSMGVGDLPEFDELGVLVHQRLVGRIGQPRHLRHRLAPGLGHLRLLLRRLRAEQDAVGHLLDDAEGQVGIVVARGKNFALLGDADLRVVAARPAAPGSPWPPDRRRARCCRRDRGKA